MRGRNVRKIAVWAICLFCIATVTATPTDTISNLPVDTTILPGDSLFQENDSLFTSADSSFFTSDSTGSQPSRTISNGWGSGWGYGWGNGWGSNGWGNGWGSGWGSGWGNSWGNGWGNGWGSGWGSGWADSTTSEDSISFPENHLPGDDYEFVSLPPAGTRPTPSAFDDVVACTFRTVRNLPGDSMYIIRIHDGTHTDTFHIPARLQTAALSLLYSFSCSERLPRDLFSLPDSVTRPHICAGAPLPKFNITPAVSDTAITGSRHVLKADCSFCDSIIWMKDETVFRETDLRVYKFTLFGNIPLREYNLLPTTIIKLRGPIDTSLILDPVIGEHAGMYRATITNQCYRVNSEWITLTVADSAHASHKNSLTPAEAEGAAPTIYPNPITDEINVRTEGTVTARLFNAEGKLIMEEKGEGLLRLNTSALPSGIYLAQVVAAGAETKRLLVK